MEWLAGSRSRYFRPAVISARDPEGFARLESDIPENERDSRSGSEVMKYLAMVVAAHGGGVDDIVVGDLLAHPRLKPSNSQSVGVRIAYTWLRNRGQFPSNAPATLNHFSVRTGQLSPAGMIDRYQLRCKPIRDLLVAYMTERQPALDYGSLRMLAAHLADLFWADLERHHPGIDTLRLPQEIADAWKSRVAMKTVLRRRNDGTTQSITEPRKSAVAVKMSVRAFYLDLAQWALDEPERWGPWATPSPVKEADCNTKKAERQQKTNADQRTRERLPVLPVLVRTAERRLKEARARLAAIEGAQLGSTVAVLGESFTLPKETGRTTGGTSGIARDASGVRRNLRAEEKVAFFAWATIEILRHTGIRIEELREISHHSIVRYKLPSSGEVVPLLQIAPSKTDKERLLLISPELADALSAVVSRLRQPGGAIPSITTYDLHEKVWNDPMPILYQWSVSGENRAISESTIRKSLNETLEASGLTDKTGNPLKFQPHDFRRIFITDAILNGLPPHIAQVIAGHDSLNTTMGYAAIYPTDAIEAHRSFIARRRQSRPVEEYRAVTPEEWDEFLGHFERRKLALGDCGRAYGTDCAHEHACVRCPVLIVGESELSRLEEIRENLTSRILEAEREGWLGDVEGLSVSRDAAAEKITQIQLRFERRESNIFLGIPTFEHVAGRTIELPSAAEDAN
ncbi:tyrosine-type recombinase/integrase [Streptomyces mirabilis]